MQFDGGLRDLTSPPKDAFIIVGGGNATGFSFSAGAQPLLFGLHPNGYPSDSSLQANIDYGGAGGFAVSQQAGPSVIGVYKFTPDMSLRFGAFSGAEVISATRVCTRPPVPRH